MCLFPTPVSDINSAAYKKGLRAFDCGACPECLAKRSRHWALRCSAEARVRKACMVTLTYDSYIRDESGNIIGENVDTRPLSIPDAQSFIKRLRSYYDNKVKSKIRKHVKECIRYAFAHSPVAKNYPNYRDFRKRYIMSAYKSEIESYIEDEFQKNKIKISYLLTSERGKSTDRAHYHAILFGIDFAEDRVPYKKSKRGNLIYTSNTLSKIWSKGICTVDCVNISSKVARYCTKYCSKDAGADETFMLVSRGIGDDVLLREFNGKSYIVDGVEYPIPKLIWNKVLLKRYGKMRYTKKFPCYGNVSIYPSSRYVPKQNSSSLEMHTSWLSRRYLRNLRDSDKQYRRYLTYWNTRGELFDKLRGDPLERISALPNEKYFSYKQAALRCYNAGKRQTVQPLAPRANQRQRFCHDFYKQYRIFICEDNSTWIQGARNICPFPSCHIRANDTKKHFWNKTYKLRDHFGNPHFIYFRPCPNVDSPF